MKNMPSIETRKEMFKFFMRTSAPRIVEKRRLKKLEEKEKEEKECENE